MSETRTPDIILAKLDRSFGAKKEELRVALCEFEGKRYGGIRVFWQNDKGEWLPGKAGVSVRAKEIKEVIEALKTIDAELNDTAKKKTKDEDNIPF